MRTSPTPTRGAKFRPDIQGVRALAVGLVVLGHAGVPGLTGGFVGVDVFFVISGLLITSLLLDDAAGGRVRFWEFYARRARRILPASTLVILVTGIASVIVFNPLRAREILVDCVWASLFAANIKFGRDGTDYFRDDAVSPLQHYWSLAVEEQFYLAWPALVAVVALGAHWSWRGHLTRGLPRVRPSSVRLGLAFALVTAGSLVLSVSRTETNPTGAYFSTFTRAWELGVGALVAICLPWLHRLPQSIRTTLTWVGLAGILLAAMAFDETTRFPGRAALLPVLATGALLAGGLGDPRFGANRLLAKQPLRFVGDISYSLYLWHWPVLIIGAELLGRSPDPAQSALLVVLAVLLSVASFYGVENRFRRPREHSERKPVRSIVLWPVSLSLVMLMVFQGWPAAPDEAGAQFRSPTPASEATPPGPAEVEASVLAARRGEPLPNDLEPSVEGVTADLTNIEDCSGYRKTSSRICQFGNPQGARTVVLFGNSHATAWLPALSANASSAGWQLFPIVKEACDYPLYVGASNHECHAWYLWAKEQIASIRPDLIVMNGYGAGENWESAISLAISELRSLSARTLMLADVPVSVQGRPVDCLAARDATLQTCNFPLHDASVRNDQVQSRIADQEGIDFLVVRDWFCFDGECPLVIGNRVVYATLGHISRTYALHISPLLAPYLKLE